MPVIWGFFVFVLHSKHMHIFVAEPNVLFSRRPKALGPLATTPDLENRVTRTVLGTGLVSHLTWKQRLDLISCTECGQVSGPVPGLGHRQAAVAEAADHEPARALFESSTDLLSGKEIGEDGDSGQAARTRRHRPRRPLVLHHLRELRGTVPGGHRARRHDPRHAPLRGTDGGQVPDRGRSHAAQRREPGRSLGPRVKSQRLAWTEALDFEVPVVTETIPDDVEYLFWVGCAGALDERARKHDADDRPTVCIQAGCQVRGARPQGVLHRRPGPSARQRVPVPDCRPRSTSRPSPSAGVRKIVASCPHCFNSISREYPALGGNFEVSTTPRCSRSCCQQGNLPPRATVDSQRHLPRPVLPGPAQRGLRRAPRRARPRPRGRADRDAPMQEQGLLLWRGRSPDVARGDRSARGSTSSGPTRRSAPVPT